MRFVGLDGLRGVAALTVLGFHCWQTVVPCGYLSVDLFFMLSGFVIASAYGAKIANGMSGLSFLQVRFRRLAPVHFVGVAIGVIVAVIGMALGTAAEPGMIAISALMTMLMLPVIAHGVLAFPLNGPVWSLCIEAFVNLLYWRFARYLSTAVLIALMAIFWPVAFYFAITLGRGWMFGAFGVDIIPAISRAIPTFACGIFIYRLYKLGWIEHLPRVSPALLAGVWVAITMMPDVPVYSLVICVIVSPVIVALMVRASGKTPAWFPALGAISYPLYAVHFPLVKLTGRIEDIFSGSLMLVNVIGLVVIVGVAYCVQRLCEPRTRTSLAGAHAREPHRFPTNA